MAKLSSLKQFPKQIKFIIGNEACERFSFYGMRSILVVFMVQYLMIAEKDAKATYHLFVSACYLLPLLGGYVADRFLGKYRTILYLSLLYCIGHATLSMFESKTGLYWGLGLIALGSGGIKPCISSFVGDQFTEKNKHLVEHVFNMFYFSVNFGSFFSTLLIPWTLAKYGPSVAFGIPGVLMGVATLIYWMGRANYVNVPPTGKTGTAGFGSIFLHSLLNIGKKKSGQSLFEVAKKKFSVEEVEGAKAAWDVFKLFLAVSAFWALFDQHGSSWVLQATQMDLLVWGLNFKPSQIAALNPIMVMVLIPLFSFGLYPAIDKLGFKMTPLRKMTAGMFLAALSFVFVGVFQMFLDNGQKLSVAWQFIPYLILTMSEVMVSIPGLEFAYTQAPRSMKGTIMSFWLLTVFFGNILTAYISKINVFKGSHFFFFFAIFMAVLSVAFAFAVSRYKVRSFLEKN
jgi:POT family proton-dependent oligopeptide transporter